MEAQLEGEERTMREMVATMQRQALEEKADAEAEALANLKNAKTDQQVEEQPEPADKSARMG